KSIRRIVMDITLAYPKDRAIAHWDYMDKINILRVGGANGKKMNIEIGRMLTPYGSNFKEDWQYTWQVDVTDFSSFLRDSVEIEYIHTGYESPDLGWDLTVSFKIDLGDPVTNYLSYQKLWIGGFQYGNPEDDIENYLIPTEIERTEGGALGRIRIQHTGHGMDRPSGCSEFCSRWREVIVDGKVIDHRDMWKDCGDNPLYPQGGTWIFDRAYWCPGDLQKPDIFNFPLTKSSHTIDLNMEPFTATNIKQPREEIASYFFQFSEPLQSHDVRIEEIIAPNNLDNYNRYNPVCFTPQIRIRNLGKENLKSLIIKYGTEGFKKMTYKWKGNLPFYSEATILLPGEISESDKLNTFSVVLSKPNGKKDEWKEDNKMTSEFYNAPKIPSSVVVEFLTNNEPEQNALFILNSKNDTIYLKSPEMLEPATNYIDTLKLVEGKYNLVLTDSKGDGLEFWFQPESGYGRLRLKDLEGNIVHLFESDCGNGQFYSFIANDDIEIDTTVEQVSVNIFPRMVTDYLTIYTTTNKISTLKVKITKDGEYIEQHEYTNIKDSVTGMDVRHLEKGRYVMEIYLNDEHKMNRRFNKR
ncbi:MAG: peptide-N-glycosidase F-related protein, partial [Bacteroidota bacterium]